jgi:hypothetical protein
VEAWVEGLGSGVNDRDACFFKDLLHLLQDAGETVNDRVFHVMLAGGSQSEFEVVDDREKFMKQRLAGSASLFLAVARHPFAEIVEIRLKSQKSVFEGCYFLIARINLLFSAGRPGFAG